MNTTAVLTMPTFAVATEEEAVAHVNRWLHRSVGMAVHVWRAEFDPVTFYWHLPVELAYATHGTLGVVGDVYLHAATGAFACHPDPTGFAQRADTLAEAHGIE